LKELFNLVTWRSLLKILIIGSVNVGKTSLLLRYTKNTFNASQTITLQEDCDTRVVEVNGQSYKLQVWDTAGQERFRTVTANFYRDAVGVLVVYDVTDNETYLELRQWLQEIDRYADQNVKKILIGNKADLMTNKVVDTNVAKEYAEGLNIPFYETSAKTGSNVEEAFTKLTQTIAGAGLSTKTQNWKPALPDKDNSKKCC